MKAIKTSLSVLAAMGCLSFGAASATQGKIGGFDIPSTGKKAADTGAAAQSTKLAAQVVVSQSPGSKITTISQAMKLVQPGGTVIVRGGVYNENVVIDRPVALIGALGDYGREPVIRPVSAEPCVAIQPGGPVARVSIEKLIFEFDHRRSSAPCIDVAGGSVAVRDSAILPMDADIPIRAAYGPLRPELMQHIARPPRDNSPEANRRARLETYVARHAQPVGAQNSAWDIATGGTNAEYLVHGAAQTGAGIFNGPAAGVRLVAGELNLDNNTIIGARKAVEFVSLDRAQVRGKLTNNILLANGAGIAASGRLADLVLTQNTIKFNSGPGVSVDARDGYGEVKILANLIMGNETGIFLSEKVRTAVVNSNLVAQNAGDAMRMSSAFFGAVAANTFADNEGCTVQFFSAEQREFNKTYVKVVAGKDFTPGFSYAETNYAMDNYLDTPQKKKRRRKKDQPDPATQLPSCDAAI